jgi:hypothetical protein
VLKPAPTAVACDTSALSVPVFVNPRIWVPVVPRMTFPKLMDVRVAERTGAAPVPDNAIVAGELPASLNTERLPATVVAVVGVKVTLKETLCPAGK